MPVKILDEVAYAKQSYINSKSLNTTVFPTYFCDASSERQKESALNWAKNSWTNKNPNAQVIIRKNTPMTNLYLDTLETRREGGRAYKVVNKDDWTYFDVREDQMLQAMQKYGVAPGGKIGGEWVFAMNGTQCKCFLVDSVEYQQALKDAKKTPKEFIKASKSSYKVGNRYTDKLLRDEYVYLGRYEYEHYNWTNGATTMKKMHLFLTRSLLHSHQSFNIAFPTVVYESDKEPFTMEEMVAFVERLLKFLRGDRMKFRAIEKLNIKICEKFLSEHNG